MVSECFHLGGSTLSGSLELNYRLPRTLACIPRACELYLLCHPGFAGARPDW
jgi:hypothetical protein